MADNQDESGDSNTPATPTYDTWGTDIPSETTVGLKVRTLHAANFTYTRGGFKMNLGTMSNITGQFSDASGAGTVRYDATNKKVLLYRGNTEVATDSNPETLTNITVRIFGN